MLMFLGAANRDPRRWERPDDYDIDRPNAGHVGFGAGIHGCVGQVLARLEGEMLLARWRGRWVDRDHRAVRRRYNNTLRGLRVCRFGWSGRHDPLLPDAATEGVGMRLASLVPYRLRKRRWEHKATALYAAGLLAGHEPEAAFLPTLCDRARVSVDVGANLGGYTLLLRKHSARVIVYEPNPELATRLERVFRLSRSVEVRRCALSDTSGVAALRVPSDHGRSTIEADNDIGGREASPVDVETRRLDEEGLGDVGFIKIDVEGHELAVLRGAEGLLRRCRPALLIEASDEHRPGALASIRSLLEPLGYCGYVVENGRFPAGGAVGRLPGELYLSRLIARPGCDGRTGRGRVAPIQAGFYACAGLRRRRTEPPSSARSISTSSCRTVSRTVSTCSVRSVRTTISSFSLTALPTTGTSSVSVTSTVSSVSISPVSLSVTGRRRSTTTRSRTRVTCFSTGVSTT